MKENKNENGGTPKIKWRILKRLPTVNERLKKGLEEKRIIKQNRQLNTKSEIISNHHKSKFHLCNLAPDKILMIRYNCFICKWSVVRVTT